MPRLDFSHFSQVSNSGKAEEKRVCSDAFRMVKKSSLTLFCYLCQYYVYSQFNKNLQLSNEASEVLKVLEVLVEQFCELFYIIVDRSDVEKRLTVRYFRHDESFHTHCMVEFAHLNQFYCSCAHLSGNYSIHR